ncbi:hypothetical protein MHU86_6812 [Fragilaria crotonensis]|nr:hypothetical protein MHU86_6812 [Fragilaria crotonensis]
MSPPGSQTVDSLERLPDVFASYHDTAPGAFPVRSSHLPATSRTFGSPITLYDTIRRFSHEESTQKDGVAKSAGAYTGAHDSSRVGAESGLYTVEYQRVPDGNEEETMMVAEAQYLRMTWYQHRWVSLGGNLFACGLVCAVVVLLLVLVNRPPSAASSTAVIYPTLYPSIAAPSTPYPTAAPPTPVPNTDAPTTPNPTTALPSKAPITKPPSSSPPIAGQVAAPTTGTPRPATGTSPPIAAPSTDGTSTSQGCSICGDGKVVSAPDAIFAFPGFDPVPCGDLQQAGLVGQVPLEICPVLPNMIGVCLCVDGTLPPGTGGGSSPPVAAPTTGTSPPIAAPNTGGTSTSQGCSICGDGKVVSAPDAVFAFPGFDPVPCGVLQQAGLVGQVPLEICPVLPNMIGVCLCVDGTLPPGTGGGSSPPVAAPTTGGASNAQGCSVCGDGKVVSAPDAIFAFPGFDPVPCGVLQQAGLVGQVPLENCPALSGLIGVCLCVDGTLPPGTGGGSSPPVAAPIGTSPPVAAPSTGGASNAQGCSVCGDGKVVSAPDAIFAFPGFDPVPCGDLQQAGLEGQVPLENCPALSGLIGVCLCVDGTLPPGTGGGSSPPVAAPTTGTSPPVAAPTTGGASNAQGCSVCGDGKVVSAPDAIFAFPGFDPVPCGDLQQAGLEGRVALENCPVLPNLIGVCLCVDGTLPPGTGGGSSPPVAAPTTGVSPPG